MYLHYNTIITRAKLDKKIYYIKIKYLEKILVYIKGMDAIFYVNYIYFFHVNLFERIKLIILPSKYIQCSSKNGIRSFLPRNDYLHRKLSMDILVTHRRGQSHLSPSCILL